MTAAEFLADAHANGHHGQAMLRRWARTRNAGRRTTTPAVTTLTLTLAIQLEAELDRADQLGYRHIADGLAGWME